MGFGKGKFEPVAIICLVLSNAVRGQSQRVALNGTVKNSSGAGVLGAGGNLLLG